MTTTIAVRSLDSPDERREFPHGHLDVLGIEGHKLDRAVFEPGWRWSESVKPIAGTELCEFDHFGFVAAGRMHLEMADGTGTDIGPGDVVVCPPGHDAWVLGDEPCVFVEVSEPVAADYARRAGDGAGS
jgi:hypothetical protein